jgi:hypothetical protein
MIDPGEPFGDPFFVKDLYVSKKKRHLRSAF